MNSKESINQQISLKVSKKSALEAFLAEKILNDLRKLENFDTIKSLYLNVLNISDHWLITKELIKIISEDDKELLYKIMLFSRVSEEISLASSNAATILNKIGFTFDNKDLKNIKLPYADLTKNTFIRTDFSNSDLSCADFTSSIVAFSDFSNCKLSELKLEKFIFESNQLAEPIKIIVSKCEKYIATLNSTADMNGKHFFRVFTVNPPKIINKLELLNYYYKNIADFKFPGDSSKIYILYWKSEFVIWNFIENSSEVCKLRDMENFDLILNEDRIAYFVKGFLVIKSIITFQTIHRLKFLSSSWCKLIVFTNNYLIWRNLENERHTAWFFKTGHRQYIPSGILTLHNDFYIKLDRYKIELKSLKTNEPMLSLGIPADYKIALLNKNFLACYSDKKLRIIHIQNQLQAKFIFGEIDCRHFYFLKNKIFGMNNYRLVLRPHYFTDNLDLNERKVSSIIVACSTITTFAEGCVQIFDYKIRKIIKSYNIPNGANYNCYANSGSLICFTHGNMIHIWDIQTVKEIKTIFVGFQLKDLQISHEKSQLCLWDSYYFYIFDINTEKIIYSIKYKKYGDSYKFAGDYLVLTQWDDAIGLWKQSSNKTEIIDIGYRISKITCSPCKKWVALHGYYCEGKIYILNIDTKLFTLIRHQAEASNSFDSCFSPCGKYLATASDFDIILWDTERCLKIAKTDRCALAILNISFSQCGRYVASCLEGNIFMIWNVEGSFKINEENKDYNLGIEHILASDFTIFKENKLSDVVYVERI